MNINDVNNPLIGGERSKGKRIFEKRETNSTDKTIGRITTQQESDIQTLQVQDTFESTENRKLAADATKMIVDNEPAPREDAVNRAKERIQTGYYNSPEFLDRLATKLVGTGVSHL